MSVDTGFKSVPLMGTNSTSQTQPHPPGCYYVNIVSGTIQRQCNPILASALAAAGFWGTDGPATASNAFPTFQAAQAFANTSTGSAAGHAATNVVSGWTNTVGDFFSFLTSRQTLVRLVEGVIGVALIWVGMTALLNREIMPQAGVVSKALMK